MPHEASVEGKTFGYLPSPGLQPNIESVGVVRASDTEEAFYNLVESIPLQAGGGENFYANIEKHNQAVLQEAFGKGGVMYRPLAYDAGAFTGAAGLIKTENPFDVFVSRSVLRGDTIRDAKIRAALENEEEIYAVMTRHPEQSSVPVRVRLARQGSAEASMLGERQIGISDKLRSIFGADFDLDPMNLYLHTRSTKGAANPAWAELQEAISNPTSFTNRSLKTINWMYGNAADQALYARSQMMGVENPWRAALEDNLASVGNMQALKERMAAGNIPAFSNLVTESQIMLGASPTLRASTREMAFMSHLLWIPRQATISAVKGSAKGLKGVDLAGIEELHRSMLSGLRGGPEGAATYLEGLRRIASSWGEHAALTPETASELGMTNEELRVVLNAQLARAAEGTGKQAIEIKDMAVAISQHEKYNIMEAVAYSKRAEQNIAELVKNTAGKRITNFMDLLTRGEVSANALQKWLRVGNIPGTAGLNWAKSTSGVAEGVSSVLGALNAETAAAKSAVGKAFKGALPILGVGLGMAALAGMMTGPSLGQKSAAAFRPEERVGVQDRVPGEPIAGVMSGNPPRRALPPLPSTHTAMIAPMRQSVDLEVRAGSTDRGRSADLQKLVSRVAGRGGNTITTVNFINGHNRLSKLRTQERIRELMDRD